MPGDPDPTELERRLRELTVLDAALRALTTLDLTQVLRTVLEHTKRVTAAEGLSLLLYDRERDELVFAATETLQENALVCRETRLPPAVGGLMSPQRLVVPVRDHARVLGTIDLRRRYDGRPFTDADRRAAAAIAADLAARGDLERVAHEPEALHEVFARLAAAVPSQDAALVVYDQARRELAFRVSHALRPGVIDGVRLRLGQGIAGWVAAHREAVRLDDASRDPRHDPQLARRTGLVPRSMLCVPLLRGDTLHGVIQVINKVDGSAFDEDELRLVRALADHAAIAIEHASLHRRAQDAARTDEATGLGNAGHFDASLAAALDRGGPLALVLLEIDGLDRVVERHGYGAARRTLAAVGDAIRTALRPGDVGARIGGAAFAAVLPTTHLAAARALADALWRAIVACPVPDDAGLRLGARAGVAVAPDHAARADDLVRAAEAALRGTRAGVGVADA
jgi:diguanylate cyclase (GGDEF)-like protein